MTDAIFSAVVCREYINQTKHLGFKLDPVLICSLPCHAEVDCLVSEAVRATSAALTYFSPQKISNRLFADGGLMYNNPSFAIYEHYDESRFTCHGNLDFSNVRMINIGTGTKTDQLALSRTKERVYVLPVYRKFTFLTKELIQTAVDAENVGSFMKILAQTSTTSERVIKFERFSADNGVCWIKLDKYKALQDVEDLTRDYLNDKMVDDRLAKLGTDIAGEYLQKCRSESRPASSNEVDPAMLTPLPSLAPPHSMASTTKSAPLDTPMSPEDGMTGRPSISDNTDVDTQAVHDKLTSAAAVESLSSQSALPNADEGHHAVGTMASHITKAVVSS